MNKTKIEWCEYTLNPITGCLNHINGLCKGGDFPCYAYKLAHGRLKQRYLANTNLALNAKGGVFKLIIGGRTTAGRKGDYADPFYPRLWPHRFTVKGIPKGSRIFLNDMSDWVGIGIPEEWTQKVLDFIRANPDYTFLTLTKQPQNLPKFSPFPENCWVGVTATNGHHFVNALDNLVHVKAPVQFISFEPLLDWHIESWLIEDLKSQPEIKWLIIGQQTPISAKTQPQIEWVQEIVEAADKAGIPVFLKGNLRSLFTRILPTWAADDYGTLRQEFPKVVMPMKITAP